MTRIVAALAITAACAGSPPRPAPPVSNVAVADSNEFLDAVATSRPQLRTCYQKTSPPEPHAGAMTVTITLAFLPDDSYRVSVTPVIGEAFQSCLTRVISRWRVRRWKLSQGTFSAEVSL